MIGHDKIKFTVEGYLVSGRTDSEQLEWMQKFFDFYHPKMGAQVKGLEFIERAPPPPIDPKKKYGGKLVENVIQAQAREIVNTSSLLDGPSEEDILAQGSAEYHERMQREAAATLI